MGGTFNAVRRGEDDRWSFDLFSNYGRTTDEEDEDNDGDTENVTDETVNNHGGNLKYDYFFAEKTYAFANASAKVDNVAYLDLRYILGAGVGRQWKETEKVKWGTEVGLSYVDEDFEEDNDPNTGLPIPSADTDFVAARLASVLAYQISTSSTFEQTAELFPSLEDSEDFIARVDNRLKMVITGKWIAQIQYVLDYDDSVPAGNDEADHRVVLSVGWSFGD
jgi:putative salt-induced outer membrane protein YdiY